MLPATPQRTAESFCTEPTPMIEPVMVCVVDTGIPRPVARNSVIAPLAEAQKPPTGFNLVIRMPMVLTIRQPPKRVPFFFEAYGDHRDLHSFPTRRSRFPSRR